MQEDLKIFLKKQFLDVDSEKFISCLFTDFMGVTFLNLRGDEMRLMVVIKFDYKFDCKAG